MRQKKTKNVKFISSYQDIVTQDALNELESVIRLMQHRQPHQVEFQNEADFEQRTQNIERLL